MEALGYALWDLSSDMGIYILFGLLIAGVLHELVPTSWIKRHLGSDNTSSVYKAALFGTPLPLCSCSVIPFATELHKSGASKGATLSFLISTPITGVDSALATFGMFGGAFTIYRVVSSVILAIAAGVIMNRFENTQKKPVRMMAFSSMKPHAATIVGTTSFHSGPKKRFSIKDAVEYGFITLLGSIAKPLAIGLIIGAFIAMLTPQSASQYLEGNIWIGYVMAIVIATPMYVCATASLPIAASLIMAGVSPGAAFVFLSAGPATNTVTMGVVKSMLGNRALVVYLSVIVIGSIGFGAVIDGVFEMMKVQMLDHRYEERTLLEQVSAGALLGLLSWLLIRERFFKSKGKNCGGGSCCSQSA